MKHKLSLRVCCLLCALMLLISGLPGFLLPASAADPADYTNTGTRHEVAQALSEPALAYYTGSNTMEVFETLQAFETDNSVEAAGSELFNALHSLMSSTLTSTISYSSLTGYWKYTDRSGGSSDAVLFYSDVVSSSYNREHVWPKSQGDFYQSGAGSDIHHLRPTNDGVNSTRSHYTMGNVRGVIPDYRTYSYCGNEVLWLNSSYTEDQHNGIVEVRDDVKGDVARIFLYVYVTYGETGSSPKNLNLFTKTAPSGSGNSANEGNKVIESLDTLLEWCEEDPVDTWEISRNDCCQVIQGNRNVFIDYPELAWMLFAREIPDMDTPSGYAHAHQTSDFTVTCVSDDEIHGTVSGSGKSFTAVPAEGWYVSGWSLDPENAATVRQTGNSFRISNLTADCTLTVHFSAKTPAVLNFAVPEGVSCAPIQAYLGDAVELPDPTGTPKDETHSYRFIGWVKTQVEETPDKPQEILPAGAEHMMLEVESTLYALYAWSESSSAPGGGDYYRVETTDGVVDGKYLIVYETGSVALDGSLEKLDQASNTVSVSISNHVIPASEDTDEAAFLYDSAAGSFLGSGGKYLGCVSSSNSIADSSEPIANSVSVSNGDASVQSNGRTLRFNKQSGQERFRYYGSGQEPIALYLCQGTAATYYYTTLTSGSGNPCEDGHDFGEWIVTSEPTCTEPGEESRTCTRCGETETRPLEALGHDWGEWTLSTEPTCTEPGEQTRTCTRCDTSETAAVEALGHDPADPVIENETAPQCTEAGGYDMAVYCMRCRQELSRSHTETEALGHDWDEGVVTAEPTTTDAGERTYTCRRCDATRIEAIDRIPFLFDDVQDPAKFYYEPVYWAFLHKPQITTGTTAVLFSPNKICTRGQVVTFLWRAMGCPEPTQTEHSFTDVKDGAYYYKAMLWAVENEITTGTSATTFSPNKEATRGQVVTFLWRTLGEPEAAQTTHSFTDVKEGAYYYDAMLWAVENEITTGTSATTFGPAKGASRGHVVTFLYRAFPDESAD